ncbi:hypothetical protein JHS3_09830 [Jeongeupia sp. HS-3]|uniref:hypothetical protein n=1 Tax=Jeongeupia sp. HS-3 TaxID=1009682 RepID=UPI0018A57D1E|nr:hypothetical protein [Jeongeupia sp. HS-3]BCL75247.1 hypothetical protein JHS3_09830 [Jeongeupia sp. HS-3]
MKHRIWVRLGIVIAGLTVGYGVYGFAAFVLGVGHMNPRLPRYYKELSLLLQFLPLMVSALAWALWLFTLKRYWLWLAGLTALWVVLSIPALQAALPYLPPGPPRHP